LNRLRLLPAHLHAQPAARRADRKVSVPEPPHQVKGLAWRLLEGQPLRVVRHRTLDRAPHVLGSPEIAVCRHQTPQRLVRPLEVVAVDEEPQPLLAIREIRKDRLRQKLVPQRLPKPLRLAHRLRMLRPTLDVPDALPPQLPLEFRLPAPRRVLPTLVRQDLLGRPVRRYPARHRLHHQVPPLMVRQDMRHHEARVVVHEYRQIKPLLPPQQKRENVRLPKLIRPRPLEASRWMLACGSCRRLRQKPGFPQNPPHLVLTHPQRLEARQRVPHPPRPVLRVRLLHPEHRFPLRCCPGLGPPHWRHERLRHQRVDPALPVRRQPLPDGLLLRSENPLHLRHARPALNLLHHLQSKRHRVRTLRPRLPPPTPLLLLTPSLLLFTSSLCHLRLSFPLTASGKERRHLLQIYDSISPSHSWRARQSRNALR